MTFVPPESRFATRAKRDGQSSHAATTMTVAAMAMMRARFDIAPECTSSPRVAAQCVGLQLLLPLTVNAVQDQLVLPRREGCARHEHGERVVLVAVKEIAAPDPASRRVDEIESIGFEVLISDERRGEKGGIAAADDGGGAVAAAAPRVREEDLLRQRSWAP